MSSCDGMMRENSPGCNYDSSTSQSKNWLKGKIKLQTLKCFWDVLYLDNKMFLNTSCIYKRIRGEKQGSSGQALLDLLEAFQTLQEENCFSPCMHISPGFS